MTRKILIAALLLASATAGAQPKPPAPDPKATEGMTDDQKKAKAKSLYDEGISHYNLGEFDLAIASFRQAYSISSAPGLLFNIAQAFRLKKDYEQASYFYTTYLRLKPDAPNRPDVEARITEMNQMLEEQKKLGVKAPIGTLTPDGEGKTGATTTTTTTTTTTAPNTTTPTTKVADVTAPTGPVDKPVDGGSNGSGASLKTTGIIVAAGGGALLITGLVFGHMASSAASDLNGLSTNMGQWTADAKSKYDSGNLDNKIAIATLALGGAAVVTGGVLWYLGHNKESSTSVAVVPTHGGTSFAVGWKF